MGWEVRRGKRYYYRKKRVNGRVRSIYCGSGIRAVIAAHEDAEKRRCATEAAEKEKAARSCATANKGASFDLFRIPIDEIPAENLHLYYSLIRSEANRQRLRIGRLDERTWVRLCEIERRGAKLTADLPSPRYCDAQAALLFKLRTLSTRLLLARLNDVAQR